MDLSQRVAKVVEELQCIQAALEHPSAPAGLAVPAVPDPVLLELKSAVDRMRLYLWAYFDSRGASKPALESTLQVLRVQRTAEMLHALRANLKSTGLPNVPSARELLTEIRAMSEIAAKTPEQKSA